MRRIAEVRVHVSVLQGRRRWIAFTREIGEDAAVKGVTTIEITDLASAAFIAAPADPRSSHVAAGRRRLTGAPGSSVAGCAG